MTSDMDECLLKSPEDASKPLIGAPVRGEAGGPYWRRKVDGRCVDNHRLVAEQMLGRKLRRGEVVHHRNGDTTDDRPENLEVMTRREHSRLHRLGHTPDGPTPVRSPRVPHERRAEIPAHVWEEHRPWLESPKAVAAELGITTAECLARARGDTQPRDYSLFVVNEGPVVWIYRPARRAQMERTAHLRSACLNGPAVAGSIPGEPSNEGSLPGSVVGRPSFSQGTGHGN